MTLVSETVLSDHAMIKFDVVDQHFVGTFEKAMGYVQGLQDSADKTNLLFKDVVASRSLVTSKKTGGIRHYHGKWYEEGPLRPEQILKIIQYKAGISNVEWLQHCQSIPLENVSVIPSKL